ncbi:MAG: MoaD/ThiS family protein [Burkholderiales bacterium]
MARVIFTANLQRHLAVPEVEVSGATVRALLEGLFATNPQLRGYLLDDQGELRKHVTIFIDGARLQDRAGLTDAVAPATELYVFQALTGG